MITKGINDDPIVIRKIRKYGDLNITSGAFRSKIPRAFLYDKKTALIELFSQYFKFSTAAFAYSINAFYRCNFGINTTGIIMSFYVISMLLTYNSDMYLIFKPFANFILPILPFIMDNDFLYETIYENRKSTSMLIFAILFCILTSIHTICIYFKKGNQDKSKRGDSWIHIYLSKIMRVNENFIQLAVEPVLTILAGILFYKLGDDLWIAFYLWIAAISVFSQQLMDISEIERNKDVINQYHEKLN